MRKGVSPVIAIVLLLMMTVAAAGAAYFWLTSMQSSIQQSAGTQIEQLTEAAGGAFQIVFANCSSTDKKTWIRIRNTGSVDIESDSAVFAKLERGGTSTAQGNGTTGENTLKPNDLSGVIGISNMTGTVNPEEYTLSVSIGSVSRSAVVNCTG